MRAWLGLALALGACGRGEAVDPCEARMAAIEARLGAAAATALPSEAPPGAELPRSERGVPLEGAPPLLVVGDEIVFAERGVGGVEDADRTAETLRGDLRRWAAAEDVAPDAPFPIALWAEPAGDAARLARILRHAPPNARFALLVRGPPLARIEGEPGWVAGAVRAPEGRPEALRERIDAAWARATSTCPGARAHPPVPASLRPAGPSLGAPSVAALMTALRACGCDGTDLVAIEAVARRALVDPDGPVHRLRATLRFGLPSDDAPALTVAPGETVAALVVRLEALDGATWIRAE